ncbi:small acid-soluble spore protein K [Pontibacillus litoralis]|uniref:Small, acid-soluble spore protein K n=1 Tax=Pontibacillus litoralis JSM 072002 TaxID=1385512 RepID=A0A0A5HWW3_9BACI|nr:small acid-soluble spore protein K [Pontibacillus litoralis]KGX88122.1 acid-soluble spore protein K [Pontibacillus litoralis JSM 072002]
MVRNKAKNFPEEKPNGPARARAIYSSKRADGSINTHPQQRMRQSAKHK